MARRIFIFDKKLKQVVELESKPETRAIAQWPIVSFRGGCNAEQVPEFNADLKRRGITGVEYQPNGDVKWDNPLARRRYLKRTEQHDRSGYYD